MDNLQKIFQLYNTEEYKAQQSQAIDTLLWQFERGNQ
jgi:hypothetical protein